MNIRIIPRLDIKGSNLVKGIHLEGLRVLGKPEHFSRYYYENGADELIYIDTVASLYERNSLLHIIEKTAQEIFIPLTVGGGLRSIEDMKTVLRFGADKIAVNTAFINNPQLIREASEKFGSSTIVVYIEAKRRPDASYECYTDNGRVRTGVNAVEWAQRVVELGAGEILLTSIDQEGTGKGYDLELVSQVARTVSIPVIASGGAGKVEDVYDVIEKGGADAVSIASILHYQFIKEVSHDRSLFEEGNINFLFSRQNYSRVKETTVSEIKKYLDEHNVMCQNN